MFLYVMQKKVSIGDFLELFYCFNILPHSKDNHLQ